MVVVWAPRRARLKRNAAAGATSVRVRSALSPPALWKLGPEVVTVTGAAGDTWNLAAPLEEFHAAGAELIEVTIRILVGYPGFTTDHSAVAQNLRHREASPEGELEATWEIDTRDPTAWTPDMDGLPMPFMLYSNETGSFLPFFGGHIGRVSDHQSPNGFHHLRLTGRGNYITLSWNGYPTSRVWPADTAGHTVVEDAIGVYAPDIAVSHEHIVDGGLSINQELEGVGKSPRDLIDFVVSRGDLSGPLDWYVRTDTDGGHKLWLILRARNPTVDIPISSLKAPVGFVKDYEYRRTMVMVVWSGGIVDAVPVGPSGAVRWRYFDYSTRIDNEPLARQVAETLLANMNVLDAISDGQVTVEFPKPVYVDGEEYPLHRIRAGWFANITGWEGGFSLVTPQIRGLEADHVAHTLSLDLGRIEDDLALAEQFFGKETKILGTPGSGLIPQNIAPPEGVPYGVQSNAIGAGSSSGINRTKLGADFDVAQTTYVIDGQGEIIQEGRKFPEQKIEIGGRLLGFRLTGNDGQTPTPGPGTISIKVYRGHAADLPAIGTLITTIGISTDVQGSKDLAEPPAGSDVIIDVTPSDYFVYEVESGVDAITNVAITALFQRSEGSSRAISSGGPAILGQTATRDAETGVVTFAVTTDRPASIQIEFGKTTQYGSKSAKSEIIRKSTNVGVVLASPFHWRVLATDNDGHLTIGADQTG